jgi:D-amino-acid dehydrogenase
VPVQSERGYHLELFDTNVRINHPIANGYLKLAITPRPTGIRFAGLVEFGSLNSKPNPKAFELLMRNAKSMFPGLTFNKKLEWSGHRPSTVDSLPVIGVSGKDSNIFFAYGHHHIGLTAGPKTGKMISKAILRDNDQYDLKAFDPSR